MTEPYDTLAECSRKVGKAFDREKDRYIELQMVRNDLVEALEAAPILSKYHGHQGFEVERFIKDYDTWGDVRRATLAKSRGE